MWHMSRETNPAFVLQSLQAHLLAHPENAIWAAGQHPNLITAADNPKGSDLKAVIDAATYWYLGFNRGKTCFPHGGIVPGTATTSHLIFVADSVASLTQKRRLRDSIVRIATFYFWDNPGNATLFISQPHTAEPIRPIHRSEIGLGLGPRK